MVSKAPVLVILLIVLFGLMPFGGKLNGLLNVFKHFLSKVIANTSLVTTAAPGSCPGLDGF